MKKQQIIAKSKDSKNTNKDSKIAIQDSHSTTKISLKNISKDSKKSIQDSKNTKETSLKDTNSHRVLNSLNPQPTQSNKDSHTPQSNKNSNTPQANKDSATPHSNNPQSSHDTIANRLSYILTLLYQGQSLSVDELASEFNVSVRTIQRDLNTRLHSCPIIKVDNLYKLDSLNGGGESLF